MNIPIFHKDIQTELKTKRSDYLTVSSRSAFVRMIPGFSLDGKYADKYIISSMSEGMQNGYNLEFKDLYKESTHYRAIAGIKDISIEFKNKMGSVRKATINWFCPTKTQLEELSIYFLQSGLTVYLDWGWLNTGKDYLIPTYPKWINDNKITINNIYDFILGKPDNKPSADKPHDYSGLVYTTNGNYDGFIGIITNFAFNMTADGSYDCKTEIASPGILGEGVATDNVVQTGAPSVSKIRNFSDYLKTGFYPQLLGDSFKTLTAPDNYIAFLDVNEYARYFGSKDAYKPSADDIKLPSEITDEQLKEFMTDSPSYVSWGYIEDNILNNSINGLTGLTFNSVSSPVTATKSVYPILRTTDLSTCIIPFDNSKYTDVTIDIKIPTETFVSSGVSSTGQYTATPKNPTLPDIKLQFNDIAPISICEPDAGKGGGECLITIPGASATLAESINWATALYNAVFRNSKKMKRIISMSGPANDYPKTAELEKIYNVFNANINFTDINKIHIVAHSSGVWIVNYILGKFTKLFMNKEISYIILDNDFNINGKPNLIYNNASKDWTIGGSTYAVDAIKMYYVYSHTKDAFSYYTPKGGFYTVSGKQIADPRFDGFTKVLPILFDITDNSSFSLHCRLINKTTKSLDLNAYRKSISNVTSESVCVEYFDKIFNASPIENAPVSTAQTGKLLEKIFDVQNGGDGIFNTLSKFISTGDSNLETKLNADINTIVSDAIVLNNSIRSFTDDLIYDGGFSTYDTFIDSFIKSGKLQGKYLELFKMLFTKNGKSYADREILSNYGGHFLLFLLPTLFDISDLKTTQNIIDKFTLIYNDVMKDVGEMDKDAGTWSNNRRIKFYYNEWSGSITQFYWLRKSKNINGEVYSSYFNTELEYFNDMLTFDENRIAFVKTVYMPAVLDIYNKILTPLVEYYTTEYYTHVDTKLLGGYRNTWKDAKFRTDVLNKVNNKKSIDNIKKLVDEYIKPNIINPIFITDTSYMKDVNVGIYYNTEKTGTYGNAMSLLEKEPDVTELLTHIAQTTLEQPTGNGLNTLAGIHLDSKYRTKFDYAYRMLKSMISLYTTMYNVIGTVVDFKTSISSEFSNKLPSKIGNYNLSMDSVITPEEANKIKRSRNFDNNFIIKFDFYVEPSPTFRRVLINAEFFRITMLNSKTILDGVSSILRSVNRALSYYWNLEIYFNESTRTYYIADANTNNTPTKDIYEFKLLSGSPNLHVVKNMSFSTKTSTLAAVNTFFASAKSSTEAGIVGQGNEVIFDGLYKKTKGTIVKDMFYTDVKKDSSITVDVQKLCDDSALNLYNTHVQQFFANKMLMYLPIPFTYKLDGKSNTINKWEYAFPGKAPEKNTKTFLYGDAGLRILLNKKMYDSDVISMIIPLEMEIEVLGISGINIGDCFQVDYMPEVFRKQGLFFVSGVTHSVANNMWITKLKSSFRIVPGMETLK